MSPRLHATTVQGCRGPLGAATSVAESSGCGVNRERVSACLWSALGAICGSASVLEQCASRCLGARVTVEASVVAKSTRLRFGATAMRSVSADCSGSCDSRGPHHCVTRGRQHVGFGLLAGRAHRAGFGWLGERTKTTSVDFAPVLSGIVVPSPDGASARKGTMYGVFRLFLVS